MKKMTHREDVISGVRRLPKVLEGFSKRGENFKVRKEAVALRREL